MDDQPYVRPDTETHTRTYWHATAQRLTPIPPEKQRDGESGWHQTESFLCTHDHASRAGADKCSARMSTALRKGRTPPWAKPRW